MFPEQSRIDPALWRDWRWQMDHSLEGADQAVRCLGATGAESERYRDVVARYPFRVTPYYLSLADPDDPNDPVRRQCLPALHELDNPPAIDADPFAELRNRPVPRAIHRYPDRVVIVTTGRCAVYCRHCTRKNTLAAAAAPRCRESFEAALRYIEGQPSVREVILSGGDPLLLDMEILNELLTALQRIAHVEVLRIGTRVPVTLPMRVDAALCRMLASHRPLWINTQFNHPAEITQDAVAACDLLQRAGLPVSNQSVLLKGINDTAPTMRTLCNRLQKNLIRPYYVFQCDPVAGTAHFATPPDAGVRIEQELRDTMGGLSLPRFVADLPGSRGKTPLRELHGGGQVTGG